MATPTNLPTPAVAGQVLTAAYVNDLAGSFRVLQVVTTNLVTAHSFGTTYADIFNFNATITPQSTSNKILVYVTSTLGAPNGATVLLRVLRGATAIGQSTAGSVTNGNAAYVSTGVFAMGGASFTVLDSPSTTSATTYKIQGVTDSGTAYVNRRANDANFGATSTITLLEISA
jgi:hypothetical protein